MSRFPKSARHPDVSSLIGKWTLVGESINLSDESNLLEFSELAATAGGIKGVHDMEYFEPAREVVGANAIRALAKGYEALDASAKCGVCGVMMGAIVQAYNASYFAARAFCMLMGFAPLDRESSITLDAFSAEARRTRKITRSTDILRLHRYRRWGHDEVWALTRRLVDTMEVPAVLEATKEELRTSRMDRASRIRNAFQYDDSKLSVTEIRHVADFPDRVVLDVWGESVPGEVRQNFSIARNLLEVCSFVAREGKMDHLLFLCISEGRVDSVSEWGKWA